jgi:uncharacterized membrane protein
VASVRSFPGRESNFTEWPIAPAQLTCTHIFHVYANAFNGQLPADDRASVKLQETFMTAETPIDAFSLPAVQPRASLTQQSQSGQSPVDLSRAVRFLGWFSVGLGAAELFCPGTIAKISGVKKNSKLIRLYGIREIAAGVGIFTRSNPAPWLWMRVAGDVIDLASLVGGARSNRRLAVTGAVTAVAGVTALDLLCAQRSSAESSRISDMERAEASVLIAVPPEECYRFWRDLRNIPRFAGLQLSVSETGLTTAHWTLQLPGDAGKLEWDAETVDDVPGERISWRHLPGSPVDAQGSVNFEAAPGNRGTIVRVQIDYDHFGKSVASPLARLIGKHPEQLLYKSLRRMKQLLEVGEILTTEGQPAGRESGATWLDSIAR